MWQMIDNKVSVGITSYMKTWIGGEMNSLAI